MGGQPAAVARAFADVGKRHAGRSALGDQFRGGGEQALLGLAAAFLLRAARPRHDAPANASRSVRPICLTRLAESK